MSNAVGIEKMQFDFEGSRPVAPFATVLVGVVGSGNLEVMVEPAAGTRCSVEVETSARGFRPIWQAVLSDFHERHALAGLRISINDMGATPAVVSLRLEQAVAQMSAAPGAQP
jgi:malonate decarboxylase delta subunit